LRGRKDTIKACVYVKELARIRFNEDIIELLQEIQWWNWTEDIIKDRVSEFTDIELFCKKYKSGSANK